MAYLFFHLIEMTFELLPPKQLVHLSNKVDWTHSKAAVVRWGRRSSERDRRTSSVLD